MGELMKYRQLSYLSLYLGVATLLHAGTSYALPDVSENAAQNVAGVLTLYPDSEDPNLAYFIPDSAGLSTDANGLPDFGFTYWGLAPASSDAGAYMSFSMKLQMDQAQQNALNSFLATGKKIAVIPFKESVVTLTSTNTSNNQMALTDLFKEFDFSSHAGPAEAEVGVNAVLTADGARVFKSQIETPQALKLDYCYKFDGLGPLMDAHISVHWSQIYTDFQEHASGGYWWTQVSIDSEIEKLRQDGAITIQIKGGTAKMEEYVEKLAQDAISRMFVSDLKDQPTSMSNLDGWSFSRFQFSYTDREQFKDEEYDYQNQDLVERDGCLDLKVGDLAKYEDQLVRNADTK
jgi:hypothetical protein